jgi:hypothetical protein
LRGYISCDFSHVFHERSYHDHCTPSRLFGEVKLRRAQLVVRLVTTCEVWVMLVYILFAIFARNVLQALTFALLSLSSIHLRVERARAHDSNIVS